MPRTTSALREYVITASYAEWGEWVETFWAENAAHAVEQLVNEPRWSNPITLDVRPM